MPSWRNRQRGMPAHAINDVGGGGGGGNGNGVCSKYCPHFNSVEEYNAEKECWKCVSEDRPGGVNTSHPVGRRHASVVVYGGSLFVYGGFTGQDEVLSDLWEFSIGARKWRRVFYGGGVGRGLGAVVPGPRAEHSSVVYGNRMVVFGGYDGKKKLNDTFVFDFVGGCWIKPKNAEVEAPNRRCKHSAVRYGKGMYVLGGFQYCDGDNYAVTDLHVLDLETFCWGKKSVGGVGPDSLQGHKAVICEDFMYVVGGKIKVEDTGNGRPSGLNTVVWVLDLNLDRWSVLEVTGGKPIPRQLHGITVVVDRSSGHKKQLMYMFGGTDKGKSMFYDDLYELQGVSTEVREEDLSCVPCGNMSILLGSKMFSDVQFHLDDGGVVDGHRCVLYARSQYFRTMFGNNMRESNTEVIEISGVTKPVFECILEFIYTGGLDIDDGQLAIDVLKAADRFSLEDLGKLCMKRVEDAVNIENAAHICELADTHNSKPLKSFCFAYIMRHFRDVIETESFHNLMGRDPTGLVKDILAAFADRTPSPVHKRQRVHRI